jgi:hypothetical protein
MKKNKRGRPSTGVKRMLTFTLKVTEQEREYIHRIGGASSVRDLIFGEQFIREMVKGNIS